MWCRVEHGCLTLLVACLHLARIAIAENTQDKTYTKLKTNYLLMSNDSFLRTKSESSGMRSEQNSVKSNLKFPFVESFTESSELISAFVQAIGGKHALRHAEGGPRNALIRHGRSRVHRARSARDQLHSKEDVNSFGIQPQPNFEEIRSRGIAESTTMTKDNSFEITTTTERFYDADPGDTLQKYFGNFVLDTDNLKGVLPVHGSHEPNANTSFLHDNFLIMDAPNVNKSLNQDGLAIDDELSSDDIETAKQVTRATAHVDVDVVTRFLRIVESQHLLGENCTAGTDLNLGEGVVDRYAQERFRVEADVAVNRANMLTRLWKYAGPSVMHSEYLLHASVFSMVEFDDDIFAAGNCYDQYQYKDYQLFCPFAYRLPEGPILVKDLAVEYKYLSNTSEWFYIARKNAERVIRNHNQFSRGFNTYTYNDTAHSARQADEILSVSYEDGKWSKPYYDCGGGNIWMLTYTVPFFGYANGTYFFKGTSGIDIDLRRVDIDQCPQKPGSTQMNIFAATDKCKKNTTECVSLAGLGFRRGSYRCVCRRGFYFPHAAAPPAHRYYDGVLVEEHYEKLMLGEESEYSLSSAFECAPCAEGCEACADASPCVAALNWPARTAILAISVVVIACLPAVVYFTIKYGHVKVVRAASPTLLRVITLGALLMYSTALVAYSRPTVYACAARVWLREIGFSLTYGALMLKTWRISVIFRVRSAKAVRITDSNLLQRLGAIVGGASAILGARTLVSPPAVVVGRTADDLKAYLCKTDWWDHAFTLLEALFLLWGIRLCIMVRKAPSEFNESRFISLAIYNEFILSIFLNISMLFLQSPANPDLLYIILFCHTQLTVTILLCIIFGSKAYMVYKGMGKAELENSNMYGKSGAGGKLASKSQYIMTTKSDRHGDAQDEFEKICLELESLRTRKLRAGNRQLATRIAAMQEAAARSDSSRDGLKLNTVLSAVADKLMCAAVTPAEDSSSSGRDHPFDIHPHPASHHKPRVKLRPDNNNAEPVMPVVKLDICDDHTAEPLSTTLSNDSNGGVFKISGEANCGDIRAPGPDIVLDKESNLDSENKGKDDVERNDRVSTASVKHSPSSSNDNSRTGGMTSSGGVRSGHARTHAIIINLDDKSRFTEEVTV